MSSGEIITWYSTKSDTQPLTLATSIDISSITGQCFSIISCLPSSLSIVAVSPNIYLYLTLLNTSLKVSAPTLWISVYSICFHIELTIS